MKKKAQLTNVIIIITLALSAAAARGGVNSATWSPTGSMSIGRFSFTATTLQNGKVLVAGGATDTEIATATAELYDPATGTFSATGSMHDARAGFWHVDCHWQHEPRSPAALSCPTPERQRAGKRR